jgi:HK97 family phage major capsid protein
VLAAMVALCLTDPAQILTGISLAPILGIALSLRGKEVDLTLKEMREEAGKLNADIQKRGKEFNERDRKRKAGEDVDLWPEETRSEWKAVNDDYDALRVAIEEEQRIAEVTKQMVAAQEFNDHIGDSVNLDSPADPVTGHTYGDIGLEENAQARAVAEHTRDTSLAFAAWALRGIENSPIGDAHREACARLKFSPAESTITLRHLPTSGIRQIQRALRGKPHSERAEILAGMLSSRALSELTGGSGGYLAAPGQLVRAIELAQIEFGAMLRVADTIVTTTGEDLAWPVGDDTANEGAYADENQDVSSSQPNPLFEQVKWGAFGLHSKFVKVPFSLMRDSVFDLETLLGRMLGERLGRKLSGECTTGQTRIRGIVPRTPAGQTSAASTALDRADIVGLQHSIDPALRPGSQFMFHDNILEALRLIEDGDGLPIYQSNARVGAADTIEGWTFEINQKMQSSLVASTKTILGGRLEYYKIRRAGTLRLKRLEERYAEYDQTAFIAFESADGDLLRPQQDAACPVKHLIQKAA